MNSRRSKIIVTAVAIGGVAVAFAPLAANAAQPVQPPSTALTQPAPGPTAEQLQRARQQLARYTAASDTSYWTMAPGHNCTNYIAWRLIQRGMPRNITWLHNASEWAHEARAHDVPVNQVPSVGAIAQWNAGTPGSYSGHVAYVEAVGANWILISEDNYGGGPRHLEVIRTGTPEWPSHFIHFQAKPATASASTDAWKQFLRTYYERW